MPQEEDRQKIFEAKLQQIEVCINSQLIFINVFTWARIIDIYVKAYREHKVYLVLRGRLHQ